MSTRVAVSLACSVYLAFMAAMFNVNLPTWCANPTVGTNWMVQPLCGK